MTAERDNLLSRVEDAEETSKSTDDMMHRLQENNAALQAETLNAHSDLAAVKADLQRKLEDSRRELNVECEKLREEVREKTERLAVVESTHAETSNDIEREKAVLNDKIRVSVTIRGRIELRLTGYVLGTARGQRCSVRSTRQYVARSQRVC